MSGWLSHAVGVSSRSEFLDATVGTDVFDAVAEGYFVLNGIITTTTTGLLFATFGLHYNIHVFCHIKNKYIQIQNISFTENSESNQDIVSLIIQIET